MQIRYYIGEQSLQIGYKCSLQKRPRQRWQVNVVLVGHWRHFRLETETVVFNRSSGPTAPIDRSETHVWQKLRLCFLHTQKWHILHFRREFFPRALHRLHRPWISELTNQGPDGRNWPTQSRPDNSRRKWSFIFSFPTLLSPKKRINYHQLKSRFLGSKVNFIEKVKISKGTSGNPLPPLKVSSVHE